MSVEKTAQTKQFRLFVMILLTVIVYIAFFLTIYPELLGVISTDILMVVVVFFIAILGAYSVFWISKSVREKREIYRKLRHYESMIAKETHTFYVYEATKEINILDASGEALIEYSFRCNNNPESKLERIRISVSHDGNLIEDSLECSVNEREAQMTNIERLLVLDEKTEEPRESMPRILNFTMRPEESVEKGTRFSYSYRYKVAKLFRYFMEKDKEFTSTLILHPTDRLKNLIRVPEGYMFNSVKFEVFDIDEVEHHAEEERIKIDCPPRLTHDKRILCWDIINPKLANIYKLYFSAEKEIRKEDKVKEAYRR